MPPTLLANGVAAHGRNLCLANLSVEGLQLLHREGRLHLWGRSETRGEATAYGVRGKKGALGGRRGVAHLGVKLVGKRVGSARGRSSHSHNAANALRKEIWNDGRGMRRDASREKGAQQWPALPVAILGKPCQNHATVNRPWQWTLR